ncbi:hypothetical protein HHI36_013041 [Cryptolaemus montrouzieri]|uniref:Uncharacterized protein n=1 Tax=Cryptolaemus montrouzieri TaxID=559131 RepID=A0ABD2NG64_9CUCU
MSYEEQQKRLQSLFDEHFGMSDIDLSDPYKDDSDDEYIESESDSEESDYYDEPATKLKKTQNLGAASTSEYTIRPNRENETVQCSSDSSSSDDDSTLLTMMSSSGIESMEPE